MNMTYELFVRSAFSIHESTMVGRGGDPAQLADTDYFSGGHLGKVKAGVAYSMEIINTELVNGDYGLSEVEIQSLDAFLNDVINAKDLLQINNLINNYEKDFVDKYIKFRWKTK